MGSEGRSAMAEPIDLALQARLELVPAAPFLFDATLHKPDHFPTPDGAWQPGVRWLTMRWHGERLGLKVEDRGTVDEPRLAVGVYGSQPPDAGFLDGLAAELTYRYNLDLDLAAFYARFQAHPTLGPVIARWRGMRPYHPNSLYEYLIIAVVLQNCTVRRSVSMMRALFERYGALLRFDGQELYGFWEPGELAGVGEEELRGLKVGYRAKSIARITGAFARGEVDEPALRGRTRDEQRRVLLGLYGIGPASVGYLLSDVFHHLDELDTIPPWEQKIYSKLFFDVDPEQPLPAGELMAYFNREFAGYRGLAVHYFWEDLFWRRVNEPVEWLERLIRL
jgi:3-methyladenine DNA glycosylase/8-oxoguanine DNA glycosylase